MENKRFLRLKTFFTRPARFFLDIGKILRAVLESIALVVVIVVLDIDVLGNQSFINTTNSIGAVVVPILQTALLLAAILGALAIVYVAAKSSFTSEK